MASTVKRTSSDQGSVTAPGAQRLSGLKVVIPAECGQSVPTAFSCLKASSSREGTSYVESVRQLGAATHNRSTCNISLALSGH